MILFMILSLILFILGVFTILAVSAGGAMFILVFGDVIVCAAIIVAILVLLIRRKRH